MTFYGTLLFGWKIKLLKNKTSLSSYLCLLELFCWFCYHVANKPITIYYVNVSDMSSKYYTVYVCSWLVTHIMNVEYAFIRYACMYLGVESQDRKTHLSNMSLFFFFYYKSFLQNWRFSIFISYFYKSHLLITRREGGRKGSGQLLKGFVSWHGTISQSLINKPGRERSCRLCDVITARWSWASGGGDADGGEAPVYVDEATKTPAWCFPCDWQSTSYHNVTNWTQIWKNKGTINEFSTFLHRYTRTLKADFHIHSLDVLSMALRRYNNGRICLVYISMTQISVMY